jgi:hypothetical protein
MAKRPWSGWAWAAVIAATFTCFGLFLPAGTSARGSDPPPGGVHCNSVIDVWGNPHAGVVGSESANVTDSEEKYCQGAFELYSGASGAVGPLAIVLAGVAVVVGIRRRKQLGVGTDPNDGLVAGDF